MPRLNTEVAKKYSLRDDDPVVEACVKLVNTSVGGIPDDAFCTFVIMLVHLERAGISADARKLILLKLADVPGICRGAIALFDARYAALVPPIGEPVHVDIQELKVVGDPVKAGRFPTTSYIIHLSQIYKVCKQALDGNRNVP